MIHSYVSSKISWTWTNKIKLINNFSIGVLPHSFSTAIYFQIDWAFKRRKEIFRQFKTKNSKIFFSSNNRKFQRVFFFSFFSPKFPNVCTSEFECLLINHLSNIFRNLKSVQFNLFTSDSWQNERDTEEKYCACKKKS